MYKINVINELSGRTYEYQQPDKEGKNALLDKFIARDHWGKKQREMIRSEVPAELESRIIDLVNRTEFQQDEEGNEVEVIIEYAVIKPDYVITETNLNLSKTYRNQKKLEARKAEYPSIEEVLHIILDHGLESQEFADLQASRAAIKAKYPLEP